VTLDTDITEDLKLEGVAREMVRHYNDLRRQLEFSIEDRVLARYEADGLIAKAIDRHHDYIKREILALEIRAGRDDGFNGDERRLDEERFWIGLKKA
jgi:isoleucyl-tRNA synthetase